jgi:uncharacterized repeat protein (TIGR01451 family)
LRPAGSDIRYATNTGDSLAALKLRSSTPPHECCDARRAHRHRVLTAVALIFMFFLLALLGVSRAYAEGSRTLYPVDQPCAPNSQGGSCRANLEWRTSRYANGTLDRRTLLYVYAQAGENILMGSSGMPGTGLSASSTSSDIVVYNPGTVTGPIGNEILPATPNFDCRTSQSGRGRITSRAQELAGPQAIAGGGNPTGYVPCFYTAPTSGIYAVAMYGPSGPNSDTDPANAGNIPQNTSNFNTDQNSSLSSWDVTVRSSNQTSIQDQTGRLFTYDTAFNTGSNGRPVKFSLYPVTPLGYRYQISMRGLDPNGWVLYANSRGFLNADGVSPLYHDVIGQNQTVNNPQGGTGFAPPQFPLFFNPPDALALNGPGGLNIPAQPVQTTVTSLSFQGTGQTSAKSVVGTGGTFTFSSTNGGTYQLVISADGTNFDPTNPKNATLQGSCGLPSNCPPGTNTIQWNGLANDGTVFPVGTGYKVQFTMRSGEYHFPMLDVENNTLGGPTITLLNPPNGVCPFNNPKCTTAFYDDRGYHTNTAAGTQVGTNGAPLCGINPPNPPFSDPINGFDSSTAQRAWGVDGTTGNLGNTNVPCTGAFGDTKGVDIWTYLVTPPISTTLDIVASTSDLAIAKSVDNSTPQAGGLVHFTLTATNNGPADNTGVVVSDPLPAGLSYAGDSCTTCYNPSTGAWTIGNMANGATASLVISATVTQAGLINNTAIISGNLPDPISTNNAASASVNATAASDLSIAKSVTPVKAAVNSNVTFTLTARNLGPSANTGVAVQDVLPSGLSYVSSQPAGAYDPVAHVWTIGSLPISATTVLTITAQVLAGSTVLTNTATISGSLPDPNLSNNSASATVTTGPVTDLSLAKVVSNSAPAVGQTIAYTLTAKNNGPTDEPKATVSDPLPAGLSYSSSRPSGAYDPLSGIWTIGSLPVSNTATLVISATVSQVGPITNTAVISGTIPDSNPGNNTASASLTAKASADLGVTKAIL